MPVLSRPAPWRRRRADGSLLRISVFLFLLFAAAVSLSAQETGGRGSSGPDAGDREGVIFTVRPGEKYRVIEKFNLSQYKNGRYLGHVYRENRGVYETAPAGNGQFRVDGRIYHLEEKTKDGFRTASALRGTEDSSYSMREQGQMQVPGTAYPRLRGFPTFPDKAVLPGQKWEAFLDVVITSPDGQTRAVLPQYCEYTFVGEDVWEDRPVYVIKAQYAVRYKQGTSYEAESFLRALSGKHVVALMIDKETREFLLMKDIMEEEYLYRDGTSLREKGFLLTFYKGIALLDRPGIVRAARKTLAEELEEHFEEKGEALDDQVSIEEHEEGLALNLKNLHFRPDQAVLLAEDRPLLDTIAAVLQSIPERSFLVRGHTADVGSMESQLLLSQQRARKIVDELSARGIDAERFLYTGLGGLEPVGDNASDEGRKMNRRVEIVILED